MSRDTHSVVGYTTPTPGPDDRYTSSYHETREDAEACAKRWRDAWRDARTPKWFFVRAGHVPADL